MPRVAPQPAVEHPAAVGGLGLEAIELMIADCVESESKALMTLLLMRVSGVTLLEDGLKASKPGYRDYIARTPAFLPWFPRTWR